MILCYELRMNELVSVEEALIQHLQIHGLAFWDSAWFWEVSVRGC